MSKKKKCTHDWYLSGLIGMVYEEWTCNKCGEIIEFRKDLI